jgi:hypothetical protein
MYVSIDSRLLGVAITVFILILTIKSQILEHNWITLQLVLSIPLLIGAMMSNARMVDIESFKEYYVLNRVSNSLGSALVFNSLGLLIASFVSLTAGISYFIILGLILAAMMIKFNKRKIYNELLMLIAIIIGGLLPALGVFSF